MQKDNLIKVLMNFSKAEQNSFIRKAKNPEINKIEKIFLNGYSDGIKLENRFYDKDSRLKNTKNNY